MCHDLRTHRSARGFSMLELMIVLVVMVGLLAIAWPNMQRLLRRTTLNEAAQVLREAIDEGRYEAITTGKPIFVQMQQGNHEVRTGSFANFANAEDADKSLETESNQSEAFSDSSATSQPGPGMRKNQDEKTPRTWRLPESIVITEVTWTSDSITDDSDWWLPISATGLSRNASIVLYDTSIHEKMTVTYASATGALEIVR